MNISLANTLFLWPDFERQASAVDSRAYQANKKEIEENEEEKNG